VAIVTPVLHCGSARSRSNGLTRIDQDSGMD
jgi:hypothetical protein